MQTMLGGLVRILCLPPS